MKISSGLAIITLMLTSHALAASSEKAQGDPQEAVLKTAIAAMQQGRSADVLAMIDPALAAYETDYAAEKRLIYCGMGPTETLLYMGMAASQKQSAIAISPNWCTALYLKAFALIDQKRLDEGLPYLTRAIGMAPYHAHFLNELGYLHQTARRWPEALDAYAKAEGAAGMAPDSEKTSEQARAMRGTGFVLIEQEKWDEAEAAFKKCLKLDPNDAKAKSELQYIKENKPKNA